MTEIDTRHNGTSPEWRHALDLLEAVLSQPDKTERGLLDQLVTTQDIADEYGLTVNAVHNLKVRNGSFPLPVKRFGKVDVYWKPEVDGWFADRRKVR